MKPLPPHHESPARVKESELAARTLSHCPVELFSPQVPEMGEHSVKFERSEKEGQSVVRSGLTFL